MIFELLRAPFPAGYGEAILSLEECKAHLRVDDDDEDDLIAVFRDAAIDFVERHCAVKLKSTTGIMWVADHFPRESRAVLPLSMGPVTEITNVTWLDRSGAAASVLPSTLRITPRGDVLPAIGGTWPSNVGGDVSIEFTAGYADGTSPPGLLSAVRLFLGHLYKNREAVTDRGTEAEVPMGVMTLCAQHRRVLI